MPQENTKKGLRLWLVVLSVSLLFTGVLWDHYFNSSNPIDQKWVSTLVLMMGGLFSVAVALFSWSMESRLEYAEREVKRHTKELQERNQDLEKALGEIKTLRGFIPICATCKKIRNMEGQWQQMELYIQQRSEAQFSHGICQTCKDALYRKMEKNNIS